MASSARSLRGHLYLPAWNVREAAAEGTLQVSDFLWDADEEKAFLSSKWNEHESAAAWYRSPWSNRYFRGPYSMRQRAYLPVGPGGTTSSKPEQGSSGASGPEVRPAAPVRDSRGQMREQEAALNTLFGMYADYYYGPGHAATSVFLFPAAEEQELGSTTLSRARERHNKQSASTAASQPLPTAAPGVLSTRFLDPDEDPILEGVFLLKKATKEAKAAASSRATATTFATWDTAGGGEKCGHVVTRSREEKHRRAGQRGAIFGKMVENIENEVRATLEHVALPKHLDLLLHTVHCCGPNVAEQKEGLRAELRERLGERLRGLAGPASGADAGGEVLVGSNEERITA
eukprot:g3911.t1